MTATAGRIELEPESLRRVATRIDGANAGLGAATSRLRGAPLPEMPSGTAAVVASGLARAIGELDGQTEPLTSAATDLRRRAELGDLANRLIRVDLPDALALRALAANLDRKALADRQTARLLHRAVVDPGSALRAGSAAALGLTVVGPGGLLPHLLAVRGGYRLVPDGRYVRVYGSRFAGDDLLSRYAGTARLPGTRYSIDNPRVVRFLSPRAAVRGSLGEAFDVTDAGFVRSMPRGGGGLGAILTLGVDGYEFSPWGPERREGLLSPDFAATATTDVTLLAGGTGASAGVSWGTMMVAGGAAGSFAPGIGTLAGVVVGLGFFVFLQTSPGRTVRASMIRTTKAGMNWVWDHPSVLPPAPGLAVEAWRHRDAIDHVGGSALHAFGRLVSEVP